MKPRVFIGSSAESLPVANAIQAHFDAAPYDIEVTLWNQGVFRPSQFTLEALGEVLTKFDFGIFVFGQDDTTQIRDMTYQTTRDNVLFELGLFIGAIGRERSFIVKPGGIKALHLPTDLLGITTANYNSTREDKNLRAALATACHDIEQQIRNMGPMQRINSSRANPSDEANNSLSHIRQDKGHLMDDSDIIIKLSMWVQEQRLRTKGADVVVNFNDLDAQLKLPHGSTARLIGEAVSNSNYTIHTKGATSMLLRYSYSIG